MFREQNGDGAPLQDPELVRDFLRNAEVVDIEVLSDGTTRPRRITLTRDGFTLRAVHRAVAVDRTLGIRCAAGAVEHHHGVGGGDLGLHLREERVVESRIVGQASETTAKSTPRTIARYASSVPSRTLTT